MRGLRPRAGGSVTATTPPLPKAVGGAMGHAGRGVGVGSEAGAEAGVVTLLLLLLLPPPPPAATAAGAAEVACAASTENFSVLTSLGALCCSCQLS